MCANITQLKPSQPLDSDYRTLVTTHKVGNYRRKWLLYAVFAKIIFNTRQRDTIKKTIMNTTRRDQTDDVVNMNNVKLVIIGDEGFMAPLFNTTKEDTTQKETQEKEKKNSKKHTT